jgi:putative protease
VKTTDFMMTSCEIVSPAGNLEKLKIAVYYGADAVYFGGEILNLRDKSKNFTIEELEEAAHFCHSHNVKSVFLLNAYVHENDIEDLEKFLLAIEHIPFNAVMVSDPAALMLVKNSKLKSRIHLSTQASTLNHLSVQFWESQGISRIVLGRETTLEDIRKIRKYTDIELEIFAHGALCIAYSGRCLLSRYLSGRDANQGACSHPCRWNFALVEEKRPGFNLEIIEHENNTQILSSKDLCLIHKLKEYTEAGVNAFKLEGRMKSLYYAANITRIYKHAASIINNGGDLSDFSDFYSNELDLVSHRPYTDDLFNEFDDMENRSLPYINRRMFLGYIIETIDTSVALVKVFNPIRINDRIEIIFPFSDNTILDKIVKVTYIVNIEKEIEEEMARPAEIVRITFSSEVYSHGILRIDKDRRK